MNKDKAIIRLFKLDSIAYLIARTNKGDVHKVLRKDDDTYHYTLDSVPMDKEQEAEFVKILA